MPIPPIIQSIMLFIMAVNLSSWTCAALIHEREGFGTSHVAGLHSLELEICSLDQHCNRSVEMAAAAQVLPKWGQPILPPDHVRIRGTTMLHKQQSSTGFEHSPHLTKSSPNVRNAA